MEYYQKTQIGHAFQNVSKEVFLDWDVTSLKNIDDIWFSFKQRITQAGKKSVGFKQYHNKKTFWDRKTHKRP